MQMMQKIEIDNKLSQKNLISNNLIRLKINKYKDF